MPEQRETRWWDSGVDGGEANLSKELTWDETQKLIELGYVLDCYGKLHNSVMFRIRNKNFRLENGGNCICSYDEVAAMRFHSYDEVLEFLVTRKMKCV